MKARIKIVLRFCSFYFKAKNLYRIDSPFVYELIQQIFDHQKHYYVFDKLRKTRRALHTSREMLKIEDHGALSLVSDSKQRTVRKISKTALCPPYYAKMLFRLVKYTNSEHILELGTSLGLTTAFLASAHYQNKIITIEGSSSIADFALRLFDDLSLNNIQLIKGKFDDALPELLENRTSFDLVFVDGNHRKESTLRYFSLLKNNVHEHSIIIFDDIYWSYEMTQAWEHIKSDPSVTMTIDVFRMGLVFFRKDFRVKQHFKYVPYWMKPWMLGFFR